MRKESSLGKIAILSRRRIDHGFTLLEVLVVVAMLAILAGIVIPAIGNHPGRIMTDEVKRLVLLVNHARQEAVMESRIWRLSFEPEEKNYSFQRYTGDGFEQVDRSLFADTHHLSGTIDYLEINGERTDKTGRVHLYPTGEQDTFTMHIVSGDSARFVNLPPIGTASMTTGADQ